MRIHSLFILLLTCISSFSTAQVVFQWEQRASLPTAGRWGAFTFEINGYGYVAGGNAGGATFSDVWRYDPLNDSWSQVASMPMGRSHGTSFSVAGKGYVSCGHLGGTYFSNSLWEYDPVLDQWTTKAPLPGQDRYSPHGFAVNGHGYVGGGNMGSANGPYLPDMYKYDPSIDQWTSIPGIPGPARYGATGFVIGTKGYVYGGRDATLTFTTELWEFDPSDESWTSKPSMPGVGRSWMMVMPFATDAVITGGAENGVITNEAYNYMPLNDAWVAIPDYPGASGWSGASFRLFGRPFGGLGRVYPQNTYHSDWWELVKIDATSIGEGTSGTKLTIFPNPVAANSTFTLDLGEVPFKTDQEVMIRDITGRTVQRIPYERTISIGGLAQGTYHVLVQSKGATNAWARLVVE